MRQQKKEGITKIVGIIFILCGLILAGIYLFVETKNEVSEEWILGSIALGLTLIGAKKQVTELFSRKTTTKK